MKLPSLLSGHNGTQHRILFTIHMIDEQNVRKIDFLQSYPWHPDRNPKPMVLCASVMPTTYRKVQKKGNILMKRSFGPGKRLSLKVLLLFGSLNQT